MNTECIIADIWGFLVVWLVYLVLLCCYYCLSHCLLLKKVRNLSGHRLERKLEASGKLE